jgi:integrase
MCLPVTPRRPASSSVVTRARVWKTIRDAVNAAPAKAGSDVRVPAKLTLHGLRDFYASCLIEKNASVKVVQVRLGHSKPSITLDKYTGLWSTGEDTTADAIESVLGGLPKGSIPAPSARVVPSGVAT